MKNEFYEDIDTNKVRREAEALRSEAIRSWMGGLRKRLRARN